MIESELEEVVEAQTTTKNTSKALVMGLGRSRNSGSPGELKKKRKGSREIK